MNCFVPGTELTLVCGLLGSSPGNVFWFSVSLQGLLPTVPFGEPSVEFATLSVQGLGSFGMPHFEFQCYGSLSECFFVLGWDSPVVFL